jgi:hypothetical protein
VFELIGSLVGQFGNLKVVLAWFVAVLLLAVVAVAISTPESRGLTRPAATPPPAAGSGHG